MLAFTTVNVIRAAGCALKTGPLAFPNINFILIMTKLTVLGLTLFFLKMFYAVIEPATTWIIGDCFTGYSRVGYGGVL
jgi:hypothetical protein